MLPRKARVTWSHEWLIKKNGKRDGVNQHCSALKENEDMKSDNFCCALEKYFRSYLCKDSGVHACRNIHTERVRPMGRASSKGCRTHHKKMVLEGQGEEQRERRAKQFCNELEGKLKHIWALFKYALVRKTTENNRLENTQPKQRLCHVQQNIYHIKWAQKKGGHALRNWRGGECTG